MTLNKFPDAEPSLTLDFLKSKQLDPRISFARASNAGATPYPITGEGTGNVDGLIYDFQENVPRLTNQGLLIEAAATNLSENSANNWVTNNNPQITADTTVVNPSGGTDTMRCTIPSGATEATQYKSGGYQQPTLAATDAVSWSTYVKPTNGWTKVAVKINWAGNVSAYFILEGEGSIVGGLDQDECFIQNVGNGWYRLGWCRKLGTFYRAGWFLYSWDYNANGNPDFSNWATPAGTGLYFNVWGTQLEIKGDVDYGTNPEKSLTSYIPTSGGAVTRASDVCQITGDNFSSWYNSNSGTILLEGDLTDSVTSNSDQQFVNFQGSIINSGDNRFLMQLDDSTLNINSKSGGTTQLSFDFSIPKTKMCLAYSATEGNAAADGVVKTAITGVTLPTPATSCYFGRNFADNPVTYLGRGFYSRLTYYPTRVPDNALQALTTQ